MSSPHAPPPRIYEHDGTFDGLLTAIARALDDGPAAAQVDLAARTRPGAASLPPDLFAQVIPVDADPRAAATLLARLGRINREIVRRLLCAFLADDPTLGRSLLIYVALTLEHGRCVDGYLTQPHVRRVVAAARRVAGETHRLKGLLRFRELADGPLWAPVEPDADVILPLALHFRTRLAPERWIIHDLRRHAAFAWDGHTLERIEGDTLRRRLARLQPDTPPGHERACQELWRTFFRHVSIPERANPTLQRRNMPRRYWQHLVEK